MTGRVFPLAPVGPEPWAIVADGAVTGGRALVVSLCWPARSPGPALHVHTREDETVVVLDGELSVRLGNETVTAGPQTVVWMPRDVPHTFANRSDRAVHGLALVCPAGLEAMMAREAAYLGTVDGAPDSERLASICAAFGVTVLGPPMTMSG